MRATAKTAFIGYRGRNFVAARPISLHHLSYGENFVDFWMQAQSVQIMNKSLKWLKIKQNGCIGRTSYALGARNRSEEAAWAYIYLLVTAYKA